MARALDPARALEAIDQPGDGAAGDPHRLGDPAGRNRTLLGQVPDGVEVREVEPDVLGRRGAEPPIRLGDPGQRDGESMNSLGFSGTRHGGARSS